MNNINKEDNTMEQDKNIRVIEINGIKVEVDLRTCKVVDQYKVGDNVKVLKKYNAEHRVYNGVIVDFVAFKELPSIVVAYFDDGWQGVEIKFETITAESKDIEIAPSLPHEMKLNKERAIDLFNQKIEKLRREMEDMTQKRDYFVKYFGQYFEDKDNA